MGSFVTISDQQRAFADTCVAGGPFIFYQSTVHYTCGEVSMFSLDIHLPCITETFLSMTSKPETVNQSEWNSSSSYAAMDAWSSKRTISLLFIYLFQLEFYGELKNISLIRQRTALWWEEEGLGSSTHKPSVFIYLFGVLRHIQEYFIYAASASIRRSGADRPAYFRRGTNPFMAMFCAALNGQYKCDLHGRVFSQFRIELHRE